VFVDNTFHIIEANSRFGKLFRYSVDEIKDKLIDIIVPKEAEEESKIYVGKSFGSNGNCHLSERKMVLKFRC